VFEQTKEKAIIEGIPKPGILKNAKKLIFHINLKNNTLEQFDIIFSEKKLNGRHHIIPRSRGGNSSHENLAVVNSVAHNKYHSLFNNMTPTEILEYLVDYFWAGDDRFLQAYLQGEEVMKKRLASQR